jgi:hypothetical protein
VLAHGVLSGSAMRMISMVLLVMSVSLCAGACAPRAKPAGYIGGALLTAAGMAMAGGAASADCTVEPDPFGVGLVVAGACVSGQAAGVMFGTVTALTGIAILVAAAASPSAPEASPEPLPALPSGPAPWPAPALPQSPSAPSGSPLAPVPSSSLSMRSGSPLAFH